MISYVEPDWLNVNETGVGLGGGVKNFNVGKFKITASATLISYTYNKDSKSSKLSIGEFEIGTTFNGIGLEGEINLFQSTNKGNSYGKGSVSYGFSGITRETATGSIYSSQGWFNGTTLSSPTYPANRMVNINGKTIPMLIFGGDIRAGFIRTTVEVNVDQIISGPMGGSGLGSDWKKE